MTSTESANIDRLVAAAVDAGQTWAATPRAERARVLGAVADALEEASDDLVPVAKRESHLPEARLRAELKRTAFQLRLLGKAVVEGGYLDVRVDHADPDWPMGAPRPDLRRSNVPLGPVVIFAASNFPFAFSVAGGDTAAALAAGCSVLVKAHGGHPELSDATAEVVTCALSGAGAPAGVFAIVHTEEQGRAVLTHPQVKAGAFTGSIPAGRALFDIAQSRQEPIPFYGELGSVNPVFVTRAAAAARGEEIATGFVGSFTMGSGQFCTKPGVLLVPSDADLTTRIAEGEFPAAAPMLNERIVNGHKHVRSQLAGLPGSSVAAGEMGDDPTAPVLLQVGVRDFQADLEQFFVECFGPTALVVTYDDEQDLLDVAESIDGQLTATMMGEDDDVIVPALAQALTRKAGRILWNQWPTGVSVTDAQQHGGPYPASTAPTTTSVGSAAISRFVRPVAWQGFPEHLLPEELREGAHALPRLVNGARSSTGKASEVDES